MIIIFVLPTCTETQQHPDKMPAIAIYLLLVAMQYLIQPAAAAGCRLQHAALAARSNCNCKIAMAPVSV
jgi:hypothetical protein